MSKVREPGTALFNYKCGRLLQIYLHVAYHYAFVAIYLTLCLSLGVICNMSIILFYHELRLSLGAFILLSIFNAGMQSLLYYRVGNIEAASTSWIRSWKRTQLSTVDRKLMKRYVRSCTSIAIKVGYWMSIKRITSAKVIGKIVFYTGKVMLTLNNSILNTK